MSLSQQAWRRGAALVLMTLLAGVVRLAGANSLAYPAYTVDGLEVLEGAASLGRDARMENMTASEDRSALTLAPGALKGSAVLAPIQPRFAFNEIIPSWNGQAGTGSGFRVYLRTGSGPLWSPWLEAGSWGDLREAVTTRVLTFAGGHFDVDTLILDVPAQRVEVRIDMERRDAGQPAPSLRLLALAYTNSKGDAELWKRFGTNQPKTSTELSALRKAESPRLPFRSQVVPNPKWIGRICAPASVSMVLGHFGVNLPTEQVAQMLYDKPSDAFGVWNRSIQGVAQCGLRGYIRRFRSWDDVRAEMKKGAAICASIRFKHGELTAPPREYRKHGTEGHLIVIDGFAPGGKILVNNSATKDYGHDEQWLQEDLAKAWFDKGGVAYVFTKAPSGKGILSRMLGR